MPVLNTHLSTRAKEDPATGRRRPVLDRLLRRCVLDDDGCLIWTGAVRPGGYGVIGLMIDGRHVVKSTHRVAYEELVGPIPEGMHIDHLCGRRRCVLPDHLEPVWQAENNRRARANNRRTHCKRGHEFTEANTIRCGSGGRNCRTCANSRMRVIRAALRARP